jgi:hypothetical protein
MTTPSPREPRAAGGLMALAILGGVVIGSILGQPTIGFLTGAAIGVGLLVAFWLIDRGR